MWFKAMLVAFFLNGLSSFGLRILVGLGIGKDYTPVYLFYWYLAGLVFILIWAFYRGEPVSLKDIVIGTVMAACSVGGQVSLGLALAYGVPGNVVYPIALGSSICIVSVGGFLIFKERVGVYGMAGIFTGLLAAMLLSVWG